MKNPPVELEELGDIHGALQSVHVPMYVLDRDGTIAWLNDAAEELVPGAKGKRFTDVLTPDQVHPARRQFALKMLGEKPFTDHTTSIRGPAGERMDVEISSVPLRKGGHIVGVFGVARPKRRSRAAERPRARPPELTARQHEVLRLLGSGLTTRQISERMVVSDATVRNHVKGMFRQLGARSRLEAVIRAQRLGLLDELELDTD